MDAKVIEKVLLTPVLTPNEHILNEDNKIIRKTSSGEILSTQLYSSSYFDADVSDFVIDFYEIIYKDILPSRMINEDGYFTNDNFAGDSMNSFNTTANKVPAAGKYKKIRTEINKWPVFLQDYYNFCSCLANFWLLPVDLGRRIQIGKPINKATNAGDYMDKFLLKIISENVFANPPKAYAQYFKCFSTFEDFCDKHFLYGYLDNNEIVLYSSNNPESIVENMTNMIKKRARYISKSKYANDLHKLFSMYNLL